MGINYELSKEEIHELKIKHSIKKMGMYFDRTDIRLENYIDNNDWVLDRLFDNIVVFTHERFVNSSWIKSTLINLIEDVHRREEKKWYQRK